MIDLQNISHTYETGGETLSILQGLSFTIKAGEQIAIMGRSGSGKSTLLNILGLMLRPSKGALYFDKRPLHDLCENERAQMRNKAIGMVFQAAHLVPSLSAEENVALPMLYRGVSQKQANLAAQEALDKVGLADRRKHTSAQLSGGQKQRVAVARAIINTPKLLIADEPTGALDEETGDDILSLFQALGHQYGMSIVMVTHSQAVATRFQRQLRLVKGKLQTDDANAWRQSA